MHETIYETDAKPEVSNAIISSEKKLLNVLRMNLTDNTIYYIIFWVLYFPSSSAVSHLQLMTAELKQISGDGSNAHNEATKWVILFPL